MMKFLPQNELNRPPNFAIFISGLSAFARIVFCEKNLSFLIMSESLDQGPLASRPGATYVRVHYPGSRVFSSNDNFPRSTPLNKING